MYSVGPLGPTQAADFERLAPFDVRAVLRRLAELPHVHAVGATLLGQPAALAIAVDYLATPAEAEDIVSPGEARLLSLAVGRRHRRLGVGSALLNSMESLLQQRGVARLACSYRLDVPEAREAVEALFHHCGWTPPALALLHCEARVAMLESPLLRRERPLPPEYEIVDWVDLTASDRRMIADRLKESPLNPASLDPFLWERGLETLNSLALRYRGEVVGWMLTRRTGRMSMHYDCLYVREDLARLGRGAALMRAAILRHWDSIKPEPGLGSWATPATLPAMIAFIRRHLVEYSSSVAEQRVVYKSLTAPHAPYAPTDRAPTNRTVSVRRVRPEVMRVPVLGVDDCTAATAAILGLRQHWSSRRWVFPFHTLGAVSDLDGDASIHDPLAARTNPILSEHFGHIYEAVRSALEHVLGGTVQYRPGAALPAFHIQYAVRGTNLPLAPARCTPPAFGSGDEPLPRSARSFVVPLALPRLVCALNVWDVSFADTVGLEVDECARLLAATPLISHDYHAGELLVYGADVYHQKGAFGDVSPTEKRITLEGHVAPAGDGWEVFG